MADPSSTKGVIEERPTVPPPPKDNSSFSFSWIAIIIRGIVGSCISLFVFTQTHRIEDEDTMGRFLVLSQSQSELMQKEINSLTEELRMAGLFYQYLPEPSRAQMTAFIKPLLRNAPYLSEIQWLSKEKDYLKVPPQTQAALEQAIAQKRPALAELVSGEKPMLSLFVPVVNNVGAPLGIMEALLEIEPLVQGSILRDNLNSIDIYIYDLSLPEENQLVYFYNGEPSLTITPPPRPQLLELDKFNTQYRVNIGDRSWYIVYNATKQYSLHTWQGAIAAGIGIFITTFIVVTAWVLLEIEKRQFTNVLHEEHVQEMEGTFDKLETTQNRLVAQENLASLGGLTAGIAHEIKNPLNFINNFSSLSQDLVDILDKHIQGSSFASAEDKEELTETLQNLRNNIQIIHEQGTKADNTIQRMLAHSRGKPGEWSKTDIHKLLEEYITFSFHGMRAKNASFNVKIEKQFDNSVKEIEVVANDISRVFLNLLNNAFQAIEDKQKKEGAGYTNPTVTVTTQNVGHYFRVRIRDNGIGISEENKSNIFTPFFTTKPTGVGTGLGLSLSYNIIVREHGGSITFETQENEYCEFIVTIPLKAKKAIAGVTR